MFGNLVAALKAYRPQIHRLQLRGSDLDVGGADQAVVEPKPATHKVSDEFTVPLCRTHHRNNHSFGDEAAW
jgi:hypothetical protein